MSQTSAVELVACEAWFLVDENGDYVVCADPEKLAEQWEQDIGERDSSVQTRLVKVMVNIPKPKPVELVATIDDLPATGELKVA